MGYDPKTRTVDYTKGTQVGDGSIVNGKPKTKRLPKIVYDWMTKDLGYQGTQWLTEPQYKTWIRTASEDQAKAQIAFFHACLQGGSAKDCMSKSQSVKIEEKEENDGHAFLSDDVANGLEHREFGPGHRGGVYGTDPCRSRRRCRGGHHRYRSRALDTCVADPISLGCAAAAVGIAGGLFPILKSGEAVQGATYIASNAGRAGRAVASGARSAWRSVQ
ncbi:hypothetical protein ACRAWF_44680 [Streptomyces sp. L7]